MKKGLLTATALLVVTFVYAAGAAATPPDQGYSRPADTNIGGPYVAPGGCQGIGGSVSVPAGQPFTVIGGWGAKHTGQVIDWLNGSTNTLSVDGGTPIDMSPYFRGLTQEWLPTGDWYDIFFYELPALALRQSETIVWVMTTTHPLYDGYSHSQPQSLTFTCTVTGA